MANYAVRYIEEVRDQGARQYRTKPLASGSAFTKGAAVVVTAGKTTECGADPAEIAGFACAAAGDYAEIYDTFGNVAPKVPIALADSEFRGTLTGTVDGNEVGSNFGLVKNVDGIWVIDRTETINTRVRITGIDDDVVVGDTNAPVTFVVLAANRQVIA